MAMAKVNRPSASIRENVLLPDLAKKTLLLIKPVWRQSLKIVSCSVIYGQEANMEAVDTGIQSRRC